MRDFIRIIILISILVPCLYGCTGSKVDEGPSPPESSEEEKRSFVVEPGLTIQLVAEEPMVQDPVVLAFDESNRLWVVEMRGFMPDIDGNGEKDPVGRISVLEDRNGDGKMDTSTVYMDSLIMPRAIAIVAGGVLVVEHEALWLTEDLDHNMRADRKTLIDPDYAGSALPEHSGNGLLRGMDNWYYNAKSRFRYQLKDGKWERDSTEFRGQWGISHDDEGRLYYNYNWSQLHADLVPPNYIGRNKNHTPTSGIDHGLTIDRRVYPIRSNPAVNRGYIPGTLDEEGKLVEFTAACSPYYYRGKTLPQPYYGNVFVCEPSGNLVKRNVVTQDGVAVSAHDPHPGKEFLASTDERFRPVFVTSGPDGAIYIADMYRGLVQHGAYVTPYLREQTIKRKLVKPINRGRVWRVVPEGWKASSLKKLSDASSVELIASLSDPNGWYRDMAQRLLVERNDTTTRQPLLDLIAKSDNTVARFHGLWALAGMNQLSPGILFKTLSDPLELIRITSLRLLEPWALKDNNVKERLAASMVRLGSGSQKEVLQVSLTAGVLDQRSRISLLVPIIEKYDTSALMRDAVISSLQNMELNFLSELHNAPLWKTSTPTREIFLEMLATSIVKKRNPAALKILLAMLSTGGKELSWKQRAILTGMSIQGSNSKLKPVVLAAAPEIFSRGMKSPDSSRVNVLASMFEWPGHRAVSAIPKNQRQWNEKELKQFSLGRQHYLTTCAGCHGSDGAGLPRFAPPLVGSDWVLGNEKRLALLLLQGLEGPVEVAGKKYDAPDILTVMPAHSTMDDGALTAIMTYIRNEWGNNAAPIGPGVVGKTRHTSQGRVQPWTPVELNQFINKGAQATESK